MADRIVGEPMRSYYDLRAPEYDDWWRGAGLFADRERPGWEEDEAALGRVLEGLAPARVLDLACGTGFLTVRLRGEVTAVDQSERMVAIARSRLTGVRVMRADASALPFADGDFDRLVTSHFYGHLLVAERRPFLDEARRVAREIVVVDSALRGGADEVWEERELSDGSTHGVYKRRFSAAGLAGEIGGATVLHDGPWFVAVRAARDPRPGAPVAG